ncbi:hypothetical protein FJT64_011460 [Amphibalanus amphitrite]|uniref:Peptidase aspartic putative domain-containing protein n=1 Tax=Amphibalanus amphitrite TaxID=1232801 RepID=A0A6A4VLU6_AMPAM|nr:hypothetical protein FJT64_011460 [Amphibalanus amphitrite]
MDLDRTIASRAVDATRWIDVPVDSGSWPHAYDPAAWIHQLAQHPPGGVGRPSAFVKSIPRITLPTYRGRPEEWPRWIGLFKALVHDQPSLTNTERITLLQSSLAGPAAQAVSGMLYNGALYGKALETLQARFGREEDIVRAHLAALFDAPSPRISEPGEVEKFQLLLHNAVTVLENLGYTHDLGGSENLRRVVERLPPELAVSWAKRTYRMRPERPTLARLDEWLGEQVAILNHAQPTRPHRERPEVQRQRGAELGIAGDRRDLRLQNVEGAGPHRTSERVSLKVSPADDAAKRIVVPEAWAVPEINVTAPRVAEEDLKRYQHLSGLSLSQYDGGCVTLLLGANVLEAVLQREVRSGRPGQPVAIRTELGWALTGFSSWLRYKRVVAWMLRFARNAAIPVNDDRRKGQLSQDEILGAEKRILLMAQKRPSTTRRVTLIAL